MNDYQTKFVTPEQAVKAVQSGDWVDYGFGAGFPELLDRALAACKGEVKDVITIKNRNFSRGEQHIRQLGTVELAEAVGETVI